PTRRSSDLYQLNGSNQLDYFANKNFTNKEEAGDYIVTVLDKSKLNSKEALYDTILKDIQSLKNYSDDLLITSKELDSEREIFNAEQKRREGMLNRLMGDYVAVKEQYQAKNFIPDANSTLRLTFGNIKGY